jgi:hypothetical protein
MTSDILVVMEYTFSWTMFFIGMLIVGASVALIVWYQPIADSFGYGVTSYERFRLYGILGCLLGFIVMLNVHTLLLYWAFGLFFGNKR